METIEIYNLIVPRELMVLLMYVPLLITIITISRYILGIKSFGIYPPIVISFAFYYLDPTHDKLTGLKYGILIMSIVILCTLLVHKITEKSKMHYMSKLAIIYISVIIGITITTALMSQYSQYRIYRLIPLPILMLSSITDRFVVYQTKKGFKTSVILTLESLIVGTLGYLLLRWTSLQELLIYHPEILLIYLIINLVVGKYNSLRILEYIRFNSLIKSSAKDK